MRTYLSGTLLAAVLTASASFPVFGQDDTKIDRGVQAPNTPVQPAQPAAPAAASKDEKTYPIPMVALAAISAVVVIAAICVPIRKPEYEEDD